MLGVFLITASVSLAVISLFRLEQRLLQGGHTEGPEIYERMLSITSHQRDANQNHNEISLHTGQNGHHNQINKTCVEEDADKREA